MNSPRIRKMLVSEFRLETPVEAEVIAVLNDAQEDGYEFTTAAGQPGGRVRGSPTPGEHD